MFSIYIQNVERRNGAEKLQTFEYGVLILRPLNGIRGLTSSDFINTTIDDVQRLLDLGSCSALGFGDKLEVIALSHCFALLPCHAASEAGSDRPAEARG